LGNLLIESHSVQSNCYGQNTFELNLYRYTHFSYIHKTGVEHRKPKRCFVNKLLWRSMVGGAIAVVSFSLTAPATKVAIAQFSPLAVTGIRGLVAGLFCLCFLLIRRSPIPARSTLAILFAVAAIGSAGFSTFLALGLQTVPATHASVFLAMLPLATAILSQAMLAENTPRLFWFGAVLGTTISVAFMLHRANGQVAIGDIYLLISILSAAWGYVRLAKTTRQLGGATTMSWVVVLGSPIYATLLWFGRPEAGLEITPASIVALLYLGTVSQSLGMFLWCWSLSTGYAALVSQTQVVQPFLSMFAAALLLGETVEPELIWVTTAVMACVGISTYAKLRRPAVAMR
jgi:drug/metabolite transporter (DMT)-like permease